MFRHIDPRVRREQNQLLHRIEQSRTDAHSDRILDWDALETEYAVQGSLWQDKEDEIKKKEGMIKELKQKLSAAESKLGVAEDKIEGLLATVRRVREALGYR